MPIREIPRSFEYTCDRCGDVHVQENACGHYTNSTPPDWLTIRVTAGHPTSITYDVKREALLCTECACGFIGAHENWIRP